ncbi:MAG: exodeoxyribonuclease VII large subunit [Patescibacteria group bacterium]
MSLLSDIRNWRTEQARIEGVESYRVLSNAIIDAIVGTLPKNKEEMLAIKGIKEARYQKYGKALLSMIGKYTTLSDDSPGQTARENLVLPFLDSPLEQGDKDRLEDVTLSVSSFLDGVNMELSGMAARVKGEISSISERDWWIYFTLKDSTDESTLNCLISRKNYEVSGVVFAVGDEIIVEGSPQIYKPGGRFSLMVAVVEVFGEGALKKAYDELYKKLQVEGLFAPEAKRALPEFAERIALITSRDGAAIDDFKMNLGLQGLHVSFYPSSVEGKRAVFEVIEAVKYFNQTPEKYDVLVIVRGGGSLESLQAFNNEALAREIAQSKIPTLAGIGHEKDVTLAALVADVMVSTPTATAKHLAAPWIEAKQLIGHFERQLPLLFQERLSQINRTLSVHTEVLLEGLRFIRQSVAECEQALKERLAFTIGAVRQKQEELTVNRGKLKENFRFILVRVSKLLETFEEKLSQYDPKRALRLGYSLIKKGEAVIKDSSGIRVGDILDIQLGKGSLSAEVKNIIE